MKTKSIKLNFIMNFLLTASSILFPLITFPYVSRVLGPIGTGNVTMGTSVVSYFTMVAMLGVPTYGVRACAGVRDDKIKLSKTVQELLIINIGMMLIAYIAFFITIFLVPSFYVMKTLYLVSSLAIILNVIGVNWLYQGLEQYSYITFISLVFKVVALVLMFALVHKADDYIWYALITVIGGFGSSIFNFIRLRKLILLKPFQHYDFKRHIRPMFTFFAMTVATTVYTNLDVVMLGLMKSNYNVGLYNAAVKIKLIMVSLVTSLGTVLLPRISYYYEQNQAKEFYNLISKTFSFVLLFAIPCCLYLMVFAKDTILLLSGKEFLEAVPAVIIITPTILLIGLSNITGIQVLVPTGKESLVLRSVVCGAVVDFVLNLMMIPKFGAAGAAFGTLAAELVVLIVQCIYLKALLNQIKSTIEWRCLFESLIPALLILIGTYYLPIESVFFRLLISGCLFFLVYGFGLLVTKEEILITIFGKYWRKLKHER
ncbi:flippase [Dubosiella newyorkensis]|uniref:flippase n=1 Tax=Dubosiella newyorkensis TaxID=1862672 RepID=UPI0023EFF765|nr:flippase [Dubosiella newyorkensis]